MSFILDALKKSETERQRQASPETAYIPTSAGGTGPRRWVWVVGALLLANVVALTFVLLRPAAPDRTQQGSVAEPVPQAETAQAPGDSARSADTKPEAVITRRNDRSDVTGAEPQRPAAADTPAEPSGRTGARALQPAPALPAPSSPAVAEARRAASMPADPEPEFETYTEARMDGLDIADLHLDIHVYSDVPSERFVFVNMNKYREGDRLDEGPSVRAIRPDGLLLEYRDRLFLLPRE